MSEVSNTTGSKALNIISTIISYVFHPLFVGVMMGGYLIFLHPTFFHSFTPQYRMLKLLAIINNNVFFPLLVVALMRALGYLSTCVGECSMQQLQP